MQIKERLAQMQDGFQKAKAQYDQKFGGLKIDPGEYKGKLSRCSLDVRKSDDNVVLSVEYTILEGKFKGFTTFDQMNLNNEWGRLFAIRFIELSGFEFPENVSLLDATVKEVAKQAGIYLIVAKQNGDFMNITPKQMIDSDENETTEVKEVPEVEEVKEVVKSAKSRERVSISQPVKKIEKEVAKKEVAKKEEKELDESEELTIDTLKAMDRKELKQVITARDIEFRVTTKHSDDDIRDAICLNLGLNSNLPEEEREDVPSDEELKLELLVFCKSHKIKSVNKDMDLDSMINALELHRFDRDSLEEDEIKLLTMLAIEECIEG
jgi:hypothetical protein